jgi:CBS domain-containing membrane protein
MPTTPRPEASRHTGWAAWWRALRPSPLPADGRERLRVVVGAVLGIFVTATVSRGLGGGAAGGWPWLVAPLGASAVLVFGVPGSPLAQPWSVVGGNTVSALVGVACVHAFGSMPALAAAMAVGLAIAAMFALRCLHPPGGASALLVALGGITDPRFALLPVLLNSSLLTAVGMIYNTATGRAYPHRAIAPPAQAPANRDDESQAMDADLDAVLARYNQVLDIGRDDLKALLNSTQLQGYQRRLDSLLCADLMSSPPITLRPGTPLDQAWALFGEHRIKALPVVDARGAIVGIVTRADFVRAAAGMPGVVGEIMTRRVRVASMQRHLAELIPLFGSSGHHHIPIVDGGDRLVGIVTQSDVVAALARLGTPPASPR